ncbi:hypothetical protein APUTEX25_004923 [Auxenochlorella protothecoides]|uniref:Uncharacterized protein n=1 Tax=Auxenochlorella protothecoides TaxID=3075 RepID=A0A3M7KUP4_AUXPR|nr:hypothetical protein APUTEX25_004923 [Auxenochlorella protothecoides]|eukprot:RMZ53435.1 hypothetical protein APUTEX25_004923 [Auxenochlorella protothecoides]
MALTLFVPIAAIRGYRATGTWAVLGAKALETGARSAAITTLLTVIAGAARVATYEDLKVALEDRAYRLHYNKLQNRTDQFCRVSLWWELWSVVRLQLLCSMVIPDSRLVGPPWGLGSA